MKRFWVVEQQATEFLIEEDNYEGVKRVGKTVSEDILMVSDKAPEIRNSIEACIGNRIIVMGTVGKSVILEELEKSGKISLEGIRNRREVFLMQIVEEPFEYNTQVKEILVIAGSDKRGTIYGMFRLSELCGVSPLIYFGDAVPEKKKELCVSLVEPFYAKEPSVKYRGFFINDEWPAFGNWCVEKFGGVNAKAYQLIFELLLRLKGNYLWPAMWRSSFSQDGPGLLNAELADIYGVIMGASHHEPMCRAGVEWQRQFKEYGDDSTWSFISNEKAITKFWENGIKRNRKFETVITIGMRGEDDSKLLPENATIQDNINVLKNAIKTQHRLIKEHISSDLKRVPRMLAIYKEVEDYYYGDENCEGLKDWDELEDVIFLLSDDNYGQLRTLPQKADKPHPGGYGMYYHFDYHGAPVSYEWMNCNRLTKTWEQMTQAYEFGVREMWIVNVGDLKAVEYPLCYFMDLAYDYDKWGINAINSTEKYAKEWICKQFGSRLTERQFALMFDVIEGYTKWNALRSPEAMREGIYHPIHFMENDRVYGQVSAIMEKAECLNRELDGDAKITYQSIIYYPAMASLNLILMYLEADVNKKLAKRGCIYANTVATAVQERVKADNCYVQEFHLANNKKWNHCMSSAHTGFRGWDDKDWTYPTVELVNPIPGGKIVVSFRGSEEYHLGAHWQDKGPLVNDDFSNPNCQSVLLDIDSRGMVSFSYELVYNCPWLLCEEKNGRVEPLKEGRKTLSFRIDRNQLNGKEEASVLLQIRFDNGSKTYSNLLIKAEQAPKAEGRESYLFVERQGYCSMRAEHYSEKKDVEENGFRVVSYLGREGNAIKAFPVDKVYEEVKNAPYVKYSLLAKKEGMYELILYILARNPVMMGGRMRFAVSVNNGEAISLNGIPENYYTEWYNHDWAEGVLSHGRTVKTQIFLQKGRNDIYVYAKEAGLILEKLVVHAMDKLPESYLGPDESYYLK